MDDITAHAINQEIGETMLFYWRYRSRCSLYLLEINKWRDRLSEIPLMIISLCRHVHGIKFHTDPPLVPPFVWCCSTATNTLAVTAITKCNIKALTGIVRLYVLHVTVIFYDRFVW